RDQSGVTLEANTTFEAVHMRRVKEVLPKPNRVEVGVRLDERRNTHLFRAGAVVVESGAHERVVDAFPFVDLIQRGHIPRAALLAGNRFPRILGKMRAVIGKWGWHGS